MDAEVRLKAGPFHLGGDVAAVHESPDDQDHEDHGHGEHGNPPIKDRRSREFLYALSHKIKIKMMTKVKRPNMKGDMCLPKVLLPRIIQEMETMMELDTSTR